MVGLVPLYRLDWFQRDKWVARHHASVVCRKDSRACLTLISSIIDIPDFISPQGNYHCPR